MATIAAEAGPSGQRHEDAQQPNAGDPVSIVQYLIRHVARAFYETRHIVLLDQLMRKEAMTDGELAGRLCVPVKDLMKASHLLIQHQLLQVHRRNEVKPGMLKASARLYYYIDYRHVVNVIKWRMWRLQKMLDEKSRSVMGGQGYVCPKCTKQYSTLDVGSLQIVVEGFLCEICNTVIVDNDNAEEIQKNKDRMQRFNQQSARIKGGLQKADQISLPPFDIAEWLAKHMPLENAVDGDGLAVATGGAREANVTVSMARAGDEEAKRRIKEAEAEAKRKANALPIWIAQSTISGDLTAAGLREGSVGGVSMSAEEVVPHQTKKAKATAELDADLDAYFAAQEESEPASPPALANGGPSTRSGSVASSASGGAKRSRDAERDEGYASLENLHDFASGGAGGQEEEEGRYGKKAKKSPESSPVAPFAADEAIPEEADEGVEGEDDRMVSCGGKMVPLREVTDEMATSLMTSEEYTAYIDMVM